MNRLFLFLLVLCQLGASVKSELERLIYPKVMRSSYSISADGNYISFLQQNGERRDLVVIDGQNNQSILSAGEQETYTATELVGDSTLIYDYQVWETAAKVRNDRTHIVRESFRVIDLNKPEALFPKMDILRDIGLQKNRYLKRGAVSGTYTVRSNDPDDQILERNKLLPGYRDESQFITVPYTMNLLNADMKAYSSLEFPWARIWITNSRGDRFLGVAKNRDDRRAVVVGGNDTQFYSLPTNCDPVYLTNSGKVYALYEPENTHTQLVLLNEDYSSVEEVVFENRPYGLNYQSYERRPGNPLRYSELQQDVVSFRTQTERGSEDVLLSKKFGQYSAFVKKRTKADDVWLADYSLDEKKILFRAIYFNDRTDVYLLDLENKKLEKVNEAIRYDTELEFKVPEMEFYDWEKYGVKIPMLVSVKSTDRPIVVDFGYMQFASGGRGPMNMALRSQIFDLAGFDYIHVGIPGVSGYGKQFFELGKNGFNGLYQELLDHLDGFFSRESKLNERFRGLYTYGMFAPAVADYLIKNPKEYKFCIALNPIFDARISGTHHTQHLRNRGIPFFAQDEWIGDTDNRNSVFSDIEIKENIRDLEVEWHSLFMSEDAMGYKHAHDVTRKNKDFMRIDALYDTLADSVGNTNQPVAVSNRERQRNIEQWERIFERLSVYHSN